MNKMLNFVIRIVTKKRKNDHVSAARKQLGRIIHISIPCAFVTDVYNLVCHSVCHSVCVSQCVTVFSTKPLREYRNEDVRLTLPRGMTMDRVQWVSVWCKSYSVSFSITP